ncbi:MAG TPA: hypothetical protein VGD39_09030, partial [Nocardioides sp.]
MSTTMRPFAVPAGGGRHVRTLTGDEAHVMTDTRGTHGALTVMELVISPMNGPGLHSHVRDDEVWFVL